MYLGVDVGTSDTKAALFDHRGHELAQTACRTSVNAPRPGWSEIADNQVWDAVVKAIGDLLEIGGIDASQIEGVGITAVMMGVWPLDGSGNIIRPPILWNDARAQELVDAACVADPDFYERIFARSGTIMQTGCILPVLAWLHENERETVAQMRHSLCAKDYIRFRLTGDISTDPSEAAVAPGSAAKRDFDIAQMRILGVEHLANLLPEVKEATTIGGQVSSKAARETGLRAGTPVAVSLGDVAACVTGAGRFEEGQAVTILGTTCMNGVIRHAPDLSPDNLGLTFTLPDRFWYRPVVNVAGTTVSDWCLTALCPDLRGCNDPYGGLEALAKTSGPGANGLVFVPYLSEGGIIAPRIEPKARAGFLNIRPSHRQGDMVRAVYEGLAYAIRDCYESLGGAEGITLVGGGAASLFWSQLIADICQRPVSIPEGTQFGAKGAALCAMVATGMYKSLSDAQAVTHRIKREHLPDPALADAYNAAFARYRHVTEAYLDSLV